MSENTRGMKETEWLDKLGTAVIAAIIVLGLLISCSSCHVEISIKSQENQEETR